MRNRAIFSQAPYLATWVWLAIFFVPAVSVASTYYVAKTGSDGNSCGSAQSQSTPKLTINAGVGCLNAGDTLIVKAGTYAEQLLNVVPSGISGSPTIIKANGNANLGTGDTVIIQAPAVGGFTQVVNFNSQQYIEFDGFIVDATNIINVALNVNASNHITIKNNVVRNMAAVQDPDGAAGIDITGGSSFCTVQYNTVSNIGTIGPPGSNPIDHGIYVRGTDNIVEFNDVSNNISHGVHLYDVNSTVHRNIIRNNRVHANGSRGILLAAGSDNIAYNNIVYGNGFAFPAGGNQGIDVGFNTSNAQVYNNTIYANAGAGIRVGPGACCIATIIRNNICWQNAPDSIVDEGIDTAMAPNLLGVNPSFVNAGAADFHLQAGSGAIGAGVNLYSFFTTDFAGTQRPPSGAWTMGAYVFGGSPLPAPTNLRSVGMTP